MKTLLLSAIIIATITTQPVWGGITPFPSTPHINQERVQRTMARIAAGHMITRADDATHVDAVRRRIAAGVRLESQRDGVDQEAQRRLLRDLAEDARVHLAIAQRENNRNAIQQHTFVLQWFTTRLQELREAEERDKANRQTVRLMDMSLKYLRDLAPRLQDSTLAPAQRDAFQADYNRVGERLPNQPLKHRIQMNRALEELECKAILKNITTSRPNLEEMARKAANLRLFMQSLR